MKKQISELTQEDWAKIEKIADVHIKETSLGAKIILICPKTEINPEELAMIQSLYSRDPASILFHLLEVAEKGAEKFMKQFYVEYNHKSIGDCGNILLAFEGVSMLNAKAIQDSQLYAGQEASTRYMDFSSNQFLLPQGLESEEAVKIQEGWRDFYAKNSPVVFEFLKQVYPYGDYKNEELVNEKEKQKNYKDWEKTLKARTFDIMRGFLPAGAATYVAWWTPISHANDHLAWLKCHTLVEVRETAFQCHELLKEVFPSSFKRDLSKMNADELEQYQQREKAREDYRIKWYNNEYYLDLNLRDLVPDEVNLNVWCDLLITDTYKEFILNRPRGQELPWQIGEAIQVMWFDMLDFGSFRDLQRHRAVIQRQGLLTEKFGMHEWYLQNLPDSVLVESKELLKNQIERINKLDLNKFDKQYLLPMGMKIPTRVSGSLAKFMYLLELRAQSTVHPTLHANAVSIAGHLRRILANLFDCKPEEIPMFINENVGEINLKRGKQDIVKKE